MPTPTKACFKCHEEKPLDEFYRHPQMGDGRLGKCKACTKADVAKRYVEKREYVREYDRQRAKQPERKAAVLRYLRAGRQRNPEKARARRMVAYHLRVGTMTRGPCESQGCDGKAQAHHEDYSKPLDVRWLCFKHHREAHGQTVGEVTDP